MGFRHVTGGLLVLSPDPVGVAVSLSETPLTLTAPEELAVSEPLHVALDKSVCQMKIYNTTQARMTPFSG